MANLAGKEKIIPTKEHPKVKIVWQLKRAWVNST